MDLSSFAFTLFYLKNSVLFCLVLFYFRCVLDLSLICLLLMMCNFVIIVLICIARLDLLFYDTDLFVIMLM